jgi:hypothetical protein
MSKRWPVKGLEGPGFHENAIDGIRSSLADVAVKVVAAEKKVLADPYMSDDEKADRIKKQEIRWQKALNKAKKLVEPVGEYLVRLRKAEEWARETKQPDLGTTREWQEAVARGGFIKDEIKDLAEAQNFDRIIEMYRKAEAEGDDVLAWLVQQHGLITTEVSVEAKSELVTAIAELHPPDPDVLDAIQEARDSLVPTYNEIQGAMGMADEHEIRRTFGIGIGKGQHV